MSSSGPARSRDEILARLTRCGELERNELRDKVLGKVDLAEVIGAEGIVLRRDGRGFRGLCPFHDDHNPSLRVFEKSGRQRFKCFSCSAGGDAIEWQRRRSGGEYLDALAELALQAGVDAAEPAARRTPRPTPKPREFGTPREAADAIRRQHGGNGATETRYRYRDPAGEVIGGMLRFDRPGERKVLRYLWRAPGGQWRIEGFDELRPHPLYRLPELLDSDGSETVFVFEGEKCAEAGASCGLVSTSSPHGARAAGEADWSDLRGRAVAIVPDRDAEDDLAKPGQAYAREVARQAHEAGAASVRIVELWTRWTDLPAGGDIADLAAGLGADELASLGQAVRQLAAEASPAESSTPSDARPLLVETSDELDLPEAFEPFPVEAIPDPLSAFVREAAEAVGCDQSMVALPQLSCLAAAIGNSLQAEVKPDWREPAILWTAVVCEPGDRKTHAMRQALGPMRKHEAHLRAEHEDAMAAHREVVEEHARQAEQWKQNGKAGDRPDGPPDAPSPKRIIATDSTIEALAKLLAKNDRGLLLVQNELGQWFADFNRYATGGRGGDAFKWAECFDAEAWTIDRVTSGSLFVPRVAVSVAGAIQPGTLRSALADRGGQNRDNGLAARFNIAAPPRRRPANALDLKSVRTETRANLGRVFDVLLALEVPRCELGHPAPQPVKFSRSGLAALREWHPRIEAAMAEREGHLRAVWSKLGGALVRYSLVLHCASWAAAAPTVGMPMRTEIGGESVERAAKLVQWFGREWDRFEEAAQSEPDQASTGPRGQSEHERRLAENTRLLRHAMACGGEITPRQLGQRDRNYRPASKAKRALEQLVGDGLGELVTRENPGGPASVVFVMALRKPEASR